MTYCTKCGANNADEAEFCAKCGASLKLEEKPSKRYRKERREDECFGLPQGGTIAGLVFGIIVILIGVSWFTGWDINIWPFIVIIVGILVIVGAIYGLSRKKSR